MHRGAGGAPAQSNSSTQPRARVGRHSDLCPSPIPSFLWTLHFIVLRQTLEESSLSAGRPPCGPPASGPAAAARPVEAGLGLARDGWPPTSALALLVKMAAVSIAATVVQSLSAHRRLSSVVAFRTRARRATRGGRSARA